MGSLLWGIAVILFVAWLLGIGGVYSLGGIVHVLLVLAIIAVVINLVAGRRVA
jgi:hypothetical protein